MDWRLNGVCVVHADELDPNTPQTPGMNRAAAISAARAGAEKLWAGTVVIHPDARTGAHHHGPVESVIYVVSGRARMRWGERLEYVAEAGPGDFIYVPPYVPGVRAAVMRRRAVRAGGVNLAPLANWRCRFARFATAHGVTFHAVRPLRTRWPRRAVSWRCRRSRRRPCVRRSRR